MTEPPLPAPTAFEAPAPLAAPSTARFVAVMAFFGLLFAGSVAGFVLTREERPSRAAVGGQDVPVETFGPVTASPSFASPSASGPIPKPVTYRGRGDSVVRIRKPEPGPALVRVRGNASGGAFTVSALNAAGQTIGLVVTTFDPYDGVRPLDLTAFGGTTSLEVKAKGAWTIEVRSVRSAAVFSRTARGSGDDVLLYRGGGGVASIRGGQANTPFTVTTHANGFPRLLVVAVGTYSGSKAWPGGDVLVEVQSRGSWSIAVR